MFHGTGKWIDARFWRAAVRLALTSWRTRKEVSDDQVDLNWHGSSLPMSGKEDCCDDAIVETIFKTIRSELIWPTARKTRKHAEEAIAR